MYRIFHSPEKKPQCHLHFILINVYSIQQYTYTGLSLIDCLSIYKFNVYTNLRRKKKPFAPKREHKYSVEVIYILVYIVFKMLLKISYLKKQ